MLLLSSEEVDSESELEFKGSAADSSEVLVSEVDISCSVLCKSTCDEGVDECTEPIKVGELGACEGLGLVACFAKRFCLSCRDLLGFGPSDPTSESGRFRFPIVCIFVRVCVDDIRSRVLRVRRDCETCRKVHEVACRSAGPGSPGGAGFDGSGNGPPAFQGLSASGL